MSFRIGVVPRRYFATMVGLAFALCLLGTFAAAQVTIQPTSGSLRWLFVVAPWRALRFRYTHPRTYATGIDISIVYYLPNATTWACWSTAA